MADQASPKAGKQLSEFTCFPLLPYEIRRLVWIAAAHVPRNVDVWARPIGTYHSAQDSSKKEDVFCYFSSRKTPGILHANSESRKICREHYELGFESKNYSYGIDQVEIFSPARIYYSYGLDRICFMGDFDVHFPLGLAPVYPNRRDKYTILPHSPLAINIYSLATTVFESRMLFLKTFKGIPEVIFYYVEPDQPISLSSHDSFEFVDYDASLMEDRGVCAEINAELERLGSFYYNIRWATLTINGQKFGMQ